MSDKIKNFNDTLDVINRCLGILALVMCFIALCSIGITYVDRIEEYNDNSHHAIIENITIPKDTE